MPGAERVALDKLNPLAGKWELSPQLAAYTGPHQKSQHEVGVVVGGPPFRSGILRVGVTFPEYAQTVGRIIFGHNAATGAYYSAGIGGYGVGYLLDEYVPNVGWRGLRTEGSADNLRVNVRYNIEVQVKGQRVALFVDGNRVLEGTLPHPMTDNIVGLFAWGSKRVEFRDFEVEANRPQAFVVMEFTPPFDVLFTDVIERVSDGAGFDAYRVSDVHKPGPIMEDIIKGLIASDVVIAEITPKNQNVFYELGYAHALGKPTILLADKTLRGSDLPFDIRGHRVIFYDNTIGGKKEIEESLRKHLASIKDAWKAPPQQ